MEDEKKPTEWPVGKGWWPILDSLYDDLMALGWDGQISQVKEKFGGLRFYIGLGDPELHARIDRAEAESCHTCEDCGSPNGKIKAPQGKKYGWILCLCDDCRNTNTTKS